MVQVSSGTLFSDKCLRFFQCQLFFASEFDFNMQNDAEEHNVKHETTRVLMSCCRTFHGLNHEKPLHNHSTNGTISQEYNEISLSHQDYNLWRRSWQKPIHDYT